MRFFRVTVAVVFVLMVLLNQTFLVAVLAVDPPSDSGTITVTGSVPPKGASIVTNITAVPPNTTLVQDELVEFTLRYSSTNTGAFPLVLQAEWGKGQIEGASEPSVALANYVVGSATKAYGETTPVINTAQRTITWSIPSLPGMSGMHEVSFKLKTTDSYTGPLLVRFPVKLKVLSPSGATDRFVEIPYRYAAPALVNPDSAPTTLPDFTPTPAVNLFESITVQSTGKTSARVLVTTALPSKTILSLGTAPTKLETEFSASQQNREHLLYLTNLAPGTIYYFQVALVDASGTVTSDIFTFTTADQKAAEATRKPTAVTFSQQREVMYSGPTSVENQAEIKPISVVQNSVLDLNLAIPNDEELKTVEVVVRSDNVLGLTTEPVNTDNFQSTTTVMTKISPSVFVGKLRMPITPGNYQIVSRIEDLYGNLSEEEIGTVKVTQPFRILNHLTGEPILGAEVSLFVYNQQTKLFETVSNISTSVQNPAFSDEFGVVSLALPPARYLAKITQPGYKPQNVEFEVGSQAETQFPQVKLEPISNFVYRQYDYGLKLFQKEWTRWMSQFAAIARSPQVYPALSVLQLSLTFYLIISLNFRQKLILLLKDVYKKPHPWLLILMFVLHNLVRYGLEFFIMTNLFFGYFFGQETTGLKGLLFAAIAILNFILWLRYLWIIQVIRK